jgi:hypothetical protein
MATEMVERGLPLQVIASARALVDGDDGHLPGEADAVRTDAAMRQAGWGVEDE